MSKTEYTIPQRSVEDLPGQGWSKNETDAHSLHSLAPYTGSFPPKIARYFIEAYSEPGEVVYDPFVGRGTTPLAAARRGRQGWGSDAFEYAYKLSKAKLNPVSRGQFEHYIDSVLGMASNLEEEDLPSLEEEDLKVFYSEETLDSLRRIREVQRGRDTDLSRFFDATMCGILHGPSSHHLSVSTKDMFPMGTSYVEDYIEKHGLTKPDKNIKKCLLSKYDRAMADSSLESNQLSSRIEQADARDTPFPDDSVDLIVTSPPYLRLVNYTWNNWIRLWWLRADYDHENENVTTTEDLDKYRTFVNDFLTEVRRVLTLSGKAVIVAGDVTKRSRHSENQRIRTAKFITEEARKLGLCVEEVIVDDYGQQKATSYNTFNRIRHSIDESSISEDTVDRVVLLSLPKERHFTTVV